MHPCTRLAEGLSEGGLAGRRQSSSTLRRRIASQSGRSRALEAPYGADPGMAACAKVRPSRRLLLLVACAQQPLGIMAIEPPAAPTLIDHPIASGMDLLLLDGSD